MSTEEVNIWNNKRTGMNQLLFLKGEMYMPYFYSQVTSAQLLKDREQAAHKTRTETMGEKGGWRPRKNLPWKVSLFDYTRKCLDMAP